MKQYKWIPAIAALLCLVLMGSACHKEPKVPENPLSGTVWYTMTETWMFFSDGTYETVENSSTNVRTEGTYAFELDGSAELKNGSESAEIRLNEDKTKVRLTYSNGDIVDLLKEDPAPQTLTAAEMMEQLWIGDYENENATATISYSVVENSVSYVLMIKTDLVVGIWTAQNPSDRVIRDEFYTVTLQDDSSIRVEVNEAYVNSDKASFAGIYKRFR